VVDLVEKQAGDAPGYNPLQAVVKFVGILRSYGIRKITLDGYAGHTFRHLFEQHSFMAEVCSQVKTGFYEELEVALNAGGVELPDDPKLQEQLLTLVVRGEKVTHLPGDHDDFANAVAGVVWLMQREARLSLGEPNIHPPIWGGVPRAIPGQNNGVGASEMPSPSAVPAATPAPAYDYNTQSDWKNYVLPDGNIRPTPFGKGVLVGNCRCRAARVGLIMSAVKRSTWPSRSMSPKSTDMQVLLVSRTLNAGVRRKFPFPSLIQN